MKQIEDFFECVRNIEQEKQFTGLVGVRTNIADI